MNAKQSHSSMLSLRSALLPLGLALAACAVDDVRFSSGDAGVPSGPVTLSVVFAGNATGTVRSDAGGLDCPGACTISVEAGTAVTLTATPGANAVLAAWSGGGCSGSASTCRVVMRSDTSVSATFHLVEHQVSILRAGSGSGTVRSTPPVINCPSACTTGVMHGGQIAVTATADAGSVFVGWASSVDECATGATCSLTIRSPVTFTATFALLGTLEVAKTGTGTGTVTSTPAGIDCGVDCSQAYSPGQVVTLSAAAAGDSTFLGWTGGGCTGTGACTVTMDMAMMVTASFMKQQRALTVTKIGSGTVTSNPAGIDCGATCTANFDINSTVTLSAMPATGSTFTGWSGACTGTGTCTVTMSAATSVTASFAPIFYALTVTRAGTGAGTVTSAPSGISCGADCGESYVYGTMVTLTASPSPGSAFTGWSGACMGSGTCTVTVTAITAVTATFTAQPYDVTVVRAGNGGGTVTSSPAGINCGADCTETYLGGSTVTLTAAADTGSTFAGWSGGCTGPGTCTINVVAAANVTATFTLNTYALTVAKGGTGGGTVTSTPAGINCGADCSESYNHGVMVVLSAAPDVGSTFAGWSGGGCSGIGTCTVTMLAATTVTATFTRNTYLLTVSLAGAGSGTVTSSPAGISCGVDCSEPYPYGTSVTLTAVASADSVFSGWSGAGCSGTGTCTVTMTAAASVTATFARASYTLSVSKAGNNTGTVTSSPMGISCGTACAATYLHGDTVTLTATPDANATFSGWSGDCTGVGACTVSMTGARNVTATFTTIQHDLTVSLVGSGTVTSLPAGINCGADCSERYNNGLSVTLVPSPAVGWSFTGWSGACSGTGSCVVTMTGARSVTATFSRLSYLLTVSVSGSGSVTSSPAGISCGADCSESYLHGALVTLFASPSPGWQFDGWSGTCGGNGTSCIVTMTAARSASAFFSPITHPLLVSLEGDGGGVVTSSPAGINCPSACTAFYAEGSTVTLVPTPSTGSTFAGWRGACTGMGTCTVTMSATQGVAAAFNRIRFPLSVSVFGDGSGGVTSVDGGINCGADCSEVYAYGTTVTLMAAPTAGSTFIGWTGACSGNAATCTVSMFSAQSVGAEFRRPVTMVTLTLSVASDTGDTSVSVSGSPSCGEAAECTYQVPAGTTMTLVFNRSRYSAFNQWLGACAGQGSTCVITLYSDDSTTAIGSCVGVCP